MNEEQLKQLLQDEMKGLKEGLKNFVKAEDIQREVEKVTKQVEELGVTELKELVGELSEAAEKQGLELQKLAARKEGEQKNKSIRELLAEKTEKLASMVSNQGESVTIKTVVSGNATNDVPNYHEPGVAQIQRGMPWIRDLFNVVTLGSNTHGAIDWWEQLAITNNASMVDEVSKPASESNLTWVRRTLSDKRIKDYIKVSKDQLKDIDFVAGEIQALINRNMRLKENEQLLTGDGTGNNIKGITHADYAQSFATAGISIVNPNVNDLIGKIKTQIRINSLDGFLPNYYCANSNLIDLVRYAKDEFGQYIFPMWAQGAPVAMQGLGSVENNLIANNTLLVGDFSLGTVYVWDGLVIEMGYIGDDFANGIVTIVAYMRENLRIKENEKQAFVYVSDVESALSAITKTIG